MTEVKIHGYLSKIFGTSFKFHLGKMSDVVKAIDAIKPNFRKKLIELQSNGYIYSLEINGNSIDILPIINGSGKGLMTVIGVILIVVAIVLIIFQQYQSAFYVGQTGISLIIGAAQIPKKINFPQTSTSTGGATFVNQSSGKSYVFSNPSNLASQGALVNIGYGKFLAGSKVVNVSVKNYSTNETFAQENSFEHSESESLKFI